jgi:hypothetical protein
MFLTTYWASYNSQVIQGQITFTDKSSAQNTHETHLNYCKPLTAEEKHSALPPKLVINCPEQVANTKSAAAKPQSAATFVNHTLIQKPKEPHSQNYDVPLVITLSMTTPNIVITFNKAIFLPLLSLTGVTLCTITDNTNYTTRPQRILTNILQSNK